MFETFYMNVAQSFYTAESIECTGVFRNNAREFLKHCETRRTEELRRAQDLLPESSWSEVIDTTDKALLTGRLDWLAKDGTPFLRTFMSVAEIFGDQHWHRLWTRRTRQAWPRCTCCSRRSVASKSLGKRSSYMCRLGNVKSCNRMC